MTRRRLGLALAALALGAIVWRARPRHEFALPATLRVEQTVVDLSGAPPAGAIVAQRPDAPMRIGGIRPGRNTNPNAGYRTALVAAAPSLVRWRTAVPERASLRFGAGVQPPDDIDPAAPGVRFTVRADHLGCYGAGPSPSPNLDRLAERGLVFEQAIAQAPWTIPSVATILTGLHPRSHGVVAWPFSKPAARPENGSTVLPDVLPALPAAAAMAGITTVGVSANPMVSRTTNLARGFETFVEFEWDAERDRTARADEVNAAFLRWLRPNRGRRFLGYLHYMDVHEPYWPPAAFRPAPPAGVRPAVARGRPAGIAERVNWSSGLPLNAAEVQHLRNLYDGGIRFWDAELERLLDGLAALGVRDSTIVVVTADHGEEFQEHGKLTHAPDPYDELLHVPLLLVGLCVSLGRSLAP